MSESASLPMNFGAIVDEEFSDVERALIVICAVSYEGTNWETMTTVLNFEIDGNCNAVSKFAHIRLHVF